MISALGGKGSGNFGHAGRPGQVGGSSDRFDDNGKSNPEGAWAKTSLLPLKGREIREALSKAYAKVAEAYGVEEEIDPTEVMSGQKLVNVGLTEQYVSDPNREAATAPGRVGNQVLVVRKSGKMAVVDGNHRLAAAAAAGRKIKATVIDMDTAYAEGEAIREEGWGFDLALMKAADARLKRRSLGGKGSGNFGHAGRPGEVGGSAPDGEPNADEEDRDGLPADSTVRSSDMLTSRMVRRQEDAREMGMTFMSDEVDESTARSIQFYQGGSYDSYNANVNTPGYSHADDIVEIQTAILENGYDGPEVLTYRGMTADPERVLQTFKPGETVEISGFQSTSFQVEQAVKFLASSGGITGKVDVNQGTLLEILATRGLHIGGGEDEFLLPHGSRFKVVGVREVQVQVGTEKIMRSVIQLRQQDRNDYPTGRVADEDDEDDDYDDD